MQDLWDLCNWEKNCTCYKCTPLTCVHSSVLHSLSKKILKRLKLMNTNPHLNFLRDFKLLLLIVSSIVDWIEK